MKSILKPIDFENSLIIFYFGRKGDYLEKCMSRAYRDMQRTLRRVHKLKKRKELRAEANLVLRELLAESQRMANSPSFDEWHKKACERLCAVYRKYGFRKFTVGHAQKWINMT